MSENTKLKEMLINYASSHQHKTNILFHLIGIPTIMLGICIPLSWLNYEIFGQSFTAAHAVIFGLFLFYLTLDITFSIVFLILGLLINQYAINLSLQPSAGTIAAIAFFGGYTLQFIGHAIEKSMPVLVKHPIQANIAAPFFVIVEIFGILKLRQDLFEEINLLVKHHREKERGVS
ncbi:MAG: Mpo1-like protein [Pseudomonadota bacterium]|nr:Mpo1-like protein [Pseudomonadota bacterium]